MTQPSFDTPFQPLKALRAILAIIDNKEDTTQVTIFRDAIDTCWYELAYQRFRALEAGAKILAEKRNLYDRVSDIDFLAGLPEGTLGREYYKSTWMEGVTPDGFRAAYLGAGRNLDALGEERALVHYRLLDMHDLLHSAVGYTRNSMGEVCILEFQGVQFRSAGLRTLSYLLGAEVKRRTPRRPIFKCIAEANRIASNCKDVATADWERFLELPMEEVREALNLQRPVAFLAHLDEWARFDRVYDEEQARKSRRTRFAQQQN